jgi:hypothetical protein
LFAMSVAFPWGAGKRPVRPVEFDILRGAGIGGRYRKQILNQEYRILDNMSISLTL